MPGETTDGPLRVLSEAELQRLGQACEDHSSLDADGLDGLFHALGVTPGHVEASKWLPVVFPDTGGLREDATEVIALALRRHSEIMSRLVNHQVSPPPFEQEDRCKSFASGYVLGAQLDPKWVNDAEAWRLVRDVAYLAGRDDLLGAGDPEAIEDELGPDAKQTIREELKGIIYAAHAIFRGPEKPPLRSTDKVGRNDPCPCGSGKKFKKCCVHLELN